MTDVGDKKGKIKMNKNNLRQKQPSCLVAFLENKHSLLPDTVFSRFTSHFSRKRIAFTLAEVLITLGIIGVVAALTLPSLVASYRKQETVARLKKFYSTFTNAIRFSEVENGDSTNWEYAPQNLGTPETWQANNEFFNKYLFPYMKGIKKCDAREAGCGNLIPDISPTESGINKSRFIFEDGSCFMILTGGASSRGANIHGLLDYNCWNGPNKAGRDQFSFYLFFSQNSENYTPFQYITNNKPIKDLSRGELLEKCSKNNLECGALIQHDNWEISKDYPVKF